jgi:hypothetical protein
MDKAYGTHTLVAAAWVPGYEVGKIANHIDHAKKVNNDASNLNWLTPGENVLAAVEHGSIQGRAVLKYSLEDEFIEEYPSMMAAARASGSDQSSIRHCCNGKCKTSKGFKWKFKHA